MKSMTYKNVWNESDFISFIFHLIARYSHLMAVSRLPGYALFGKKAGVNGKPIENDHAMACYQFKLKTKV